MLGIALDCRSRCPCTAEESDGSPLDYALLMRLPITELEDWAAAIGDSRWPRLVCFDSVFDQLD